MTTSRFVRWAPLTGAIFFVLAAVGAVVTSKDSPEFVGPPQEFATYFKDNDGRIILGSVLALTGMFFLLWFLGSLAAVLRRAEGGDGRVSRLAYGGGLVGSAMLIACYTIGLVGALRVDEQKTISDDLATAYGDLSTALGFIGAPYALAVLVGGTALVGLRAGLWPARWNWLSAVVALGLLVPFISWLFVGIFAIWVLVMSILLFLRQPADAA